MVRLIESKKYTLRMNGPNGNLSDEFEFDSVKDAVKYASKCDIYTHYFISDESGNVIKRGKCNTIRESQRNRRMTEEIVDTSDDEDIDDDNYTNEEKDAIIAEKRLRHYLLDDNYYAWDAFAFNRIIDALLDLDKKQREFYRSGKKKNRASERRLYQLSMHVDALIQDADREAGNPVIAIDYSEIFDKFPELEQNAKRIGLKTK